VIRLDYTRPDEVFSLRGIATTLRSSAARRAYTAFGTAAVFVLLLWGSEAWRLSVAQDRLVALNDRYRIVAAQRKKTEALVSRIGVLTVLKSQIDDVRLSGEQRAAEIVEIGNELPPSVWLNSLKPSDKEWHLSGYAASMDQIGKALVSLQNIPDTGQPRLRHIVGGGNGSSIQYDLDVERSGSK